MWLHQRKIILNMLNVIGDWIGVIVTLKDKKMMQMIANTSSNHQCAAEYFLSRPGPRVPGSRVMIPSSRGQHQE